MPLTEIQRNILRYIEEETAHEGMPPTLRAIRDAFRFKAIGTVQDHVRALIQKGFLERERGKARGLRLPERHRSTSMSIPILGAVTAGVPREAEELILGSLSVPSKFSKQGKTFALKVKGESMIGAGINDGDIVIVRQQNHVKHGDIVVALVDGETTVKRLERKGETTRLIAENPKFSPIEIRSEKDVIQGKVVGVQRYYE